MSRPGFKSTVVLRGGQKFDAYFLTWEGPSAGPRKSMAEFMVEGRAATGKATISLSNGWGTGKFEAFRLTEESQDQLIEWARTEDGGKRKIAKTPRSTGRPRGKRAPKIDPRQMKLLGLMLPVFLAGCASLFVPLTKLNVSTDFSPREMEIIIQTADAWCQQTDVACVPVSVGKGTGGHIRPAKRKQTCNEEWRGGTYFSAVKAPLIELCTDQLNDRELAWVAAHEIGHALNPTRLDDPDDGLVMNKRVQKGELRFNEVDIEYVEGT